MKKVFRYEIVGYEIDVEEDGDEGVRNVVFEEVLWETTELNNERAEALCQAFGIEGYEFK